MGKTDCMIYYKGPKECYESIEWCAGELGFELRRIKLTSLDYYIGRGTYTGDDYEVDKSRLETLDVRVENMKKYFMSF